MSTNILYYFFIDGELYWQIKIICYLYNEKILLTNESFSSESDVFRLRIGVIAW